MAAAGVTHDCLFVRLILLLLLIGANDFEALLSALEQSLLLLLTDQIHDSRQVVVRVRDIAMVVAVNWQVLSMLRDCLDVVVVN